MNEHVLEYLRHRLRKSMKRYRESSRIKFHAKGNVYQLSDKDKPIPFDELMKTF